MFKTNSDNNKLIVSIDGNIGSGKSTLFNNLKTKLEKRKDICFLEEPVDEWSNIKDENGVTMLENYCMNQEKHAFAFQVMASSTRIKMLMEAIQDPDIKFIISERSILSDKNVFAKMLFDSGKISFIDYNVYKLLYNAHKEIMKNTIIVYVRTNSDICLKRIKKRNRKGEDAIEQSYLELCHEYHEKWIMNDKVNHKLVINGNLDNITNPKQNNIWVNTFCEFLDFYNTNFVIDSSPLTDEYIMKLKSHKKCKNENIVYA